MPRASATRRQQLEANNIDDRMPGRHEGRLAAERDQRCDSRPPAPPPRPRPEGRRRERSRRPRRDGRAEAVRCDGRPPTPRRLSRSLSTASCAVGQSRPAPATRIFACLRGGLRDRSAPPKPRRAATPISSPRSAAMPQRAGVARGVAPRITRPQGLTRSPLQTIGRLQDRDAGHQPLRPDLTGRLDREQRPTLVRDADHRIHIGRRPALPREPASPTRRFARHETRFRNRRTRPGPRPVNAGRPAPTEATRLGERSTTSDARHRCSLYHRSHARVQRQTLGNGLRVLTAPLPASQCVTSS